MNKKSLIIVVCLTVAALCLLVIIMASIAGGDNNSATTDPSGSQSTSQPAGNQGSKGDNEIGNGLVPDGNSGSQGESGGIIVNVDGNGDDSSKPAVNPDGEEGLPGGNNTPSGGQQGGDTQTDATEPGTTEPGEEGGGEVPDNSGKGDGEFDAVIDADKLFGRK